VRGPGPSLCQTVRSVHWMTFRQVLLRLLTKLRYLDFALRAFLAGGLNYYNHLLLSNQASIENLTLLTANWEVFKG
jgi:hypothetical protein